jgi:hypothetical protein
MKILLTFTIAGYEGIVPWTANANIGSIASGDKVIAPAAEDAVISAESVNYICVGTAQDQVVAFSASKRPCACDKIG